MGSYCRLGIRSGKYRFVVPRVRRRLACNLCCGRDLDREFGWVHLLVESFELLASVPLFCGSDFPCCPAFCLLWSSLHNFLFAGKGVDRLDSPTVVQASVVSIPRLEFIVASFWLTAIITYHVISRSVVIRVYKTPRIARFICYSIVKQSIDRATLVLITGFTDRDSTCRTIIYQANRLTHCPLSSTGGRYQRGRRIVESLLRYTFAILLQLSVCRTSSWYRRYRYIGLVVGLFLIE